MKFAKILLVAIASIAFGAGAWATPPGKNVTFKTAEGAVTFDGKVHAAKGAKCNDCHPKVFQMKSGATKVTMAAMQKGQSCGSCHDGKKAFGVADQSKCGTCHKK